MFFVFCGLRSPACFITLLFRLAVCLFVMVFLLVVWVVNSVVHSSGNFVCVFVFFICSSSVFCCCCLCSLCLFVVA